ncbi:GAF domain-containing protein [Anaerobacillus alkalilacustris]|uniref:GAF domain-containing protein n=1 Tax=Anaerobacillus alkalilacustris TaxID=393763 RepID=A0A1S2LMY5_9BACI|nr:GAF domain-containing protein [Anaerobacillus alkalilacustris]OIJ13694.1 GAF domain-containing protein [Anaerobacillus alkalilacustris]
MSISTDVASIQIMAEVYKKNSTQSVFEKTVNSLVQEVPYIDWVGIYLITEDQNLQLVESSDDADDLGWEYNGELKFPITNSMEQQIGLIVVRSKQAIAFDVTDVTTLETIAEAIGQICYSN